MFKYFNSTLQLKANCMGLFNCKGKPLKDRAIFLNWYWDAGVISNTPMVLWFYQWSDTLAAAWLRDRTNTNENSYQSLETPNINLFANVIIPSIVSPIFGEASVYNNLAPFQDIQRQDGLRITGCGMLGQHLINNSYRIKRVEFFFTPNLTTGALGNVVTNFNQYPWQLNVIDSNHTGQLRNKGIILNPNPESLMQYGSLNFFNTLSMNTPLISADCDFTLGAETNINIPLPLEFIALALRSQFTLKLIIDEKISQIDFLFNE